MDPKSESENESPTPPSSGSNNNNNSSSSSSSPPPPASPPPSPPSDSKNNNSSSSASSPPPPASPPPSPPASPPPSPPQSPPQSPPPSQGSPPPPNQDSSSSPPPPPTKSDTPSPPNSQSPPPPSPPPPPSNTPSPPAPAGSIPPPTNRPTAGSAFSPPPPVSVTPASSSKSPPPSRSTPPANKSPGSSSAGDPAPSSDSSISSVGIIAGIAVAGIVVLAFIILCLACSRRRKKRQYYFDPSHHHKDQYYNGSVHSPRPIDHMNKLPPPPGGAGGWAAPPPPPTGIISSDYSSGYSGQHNTHLPPPSPKMGNLGGLNQSQFTYEELATATSGFSQANLLGQGGFGYVHKGFLPDGRTIAVKSLKSGSGQGEREFQAEVEIISRVHHRHLVSLVGYCITESQRMLVYEFVANKTLEFHLHGTGKPPMDWSSRLRIAVGSAKGLAYLHEDCHPRIIHRDIKTANILLDNNYEAMVADFGLAKLTSDNDTHVSTRVMGTFGYLAPEYAQSGKLTEKSDVFSFGVMLLELITGRKPVDSTNKVMEDSLVDWARPLLTKALEDGNYDQLADPRLEGNYIPHEMARMVASAAASIRHSARRRPKMSQIVRALQGDSALEDLNDGVKPGQSSAYGTTGGSVGYDTGAYNADMMKFRKMIMPSQEMTSGEYGATSEYGLNPSSSSSDSRGNSGPQRLKR